MTRTNNMKTDAKFSMSSFSTPWPAWAKALASLVILYHMAAILSGAMAGHPSSIIEQRAAHFFKPYHQLINQGYAYRYYARLDMSVDPSHPRPWGTPVVTAEMEFDRPEGRKEAESLRLPARRPASPRLRHQRELDLAYHLAANPRWAASYARHLCKTRGCSRVTISTREHRIPPLALVRQAASDPSAPAVDLDAESTYSPSVKLGEFRCEDF